MGKLLLIVSFFLFMISCSSNSEEKDEHESKVEESHEENNYQRQRSYSPPPAPTNIKIPDYSKSVKSAERNGWDEDYKRMFMSLCSSGIKSSDAPISDRDIRRVCECEIEKISKRYPNPNVQFDPQVLMTLEEQCAREVLGL